MNDNAVELITEIMARNAQENHDILTSLHVEEAALVRYFEATIPRLVNGIPNGGTTAQYEYGLRCIESAMYPSHEALEPFRKQVRRDLS